MKAKIIEKYGRHPRYIGGNRHARMQVRSGRNGTGKLIYSCGFWPESGQSVSEAIEWCKDAAKKAGVTALWSATNDYDDDHNIFDPNWSDDYYE